MTNDRFSSAHACITTAGARNRKVTRTRTDQHVRSFMPSPERNRIRRDSNGRFHCPWCARDGPVALILLSCDADGLEVGQLR
jgi:hypothetical protein